MIYFLSIAVCNIPEVDVIFFVMHSDMVSDSDFVTMTTFLSDLIYNFDIPSQRMKIGVVHLGALTKKLSKVVITSD